MDGYDYLTLEPIPEFFTVWTNSWDNKKFYRLSTTFVEIGGKVIQWQPPAGFVLQVRKKSIISFWQLKYGHEFPGITIEKFYHNDKNCKLESR